MLSAFRIYGWNLSLICQPSDMRGKPEVRPKPWVLQKLYPELNVAWRPKLTDLACAFLPSFLAQIVVRYSYHEQEHWSKKIGKIYGLDVFASSKSFWGLHSIFLFMIDQVEFGYNIPNVVPIRGCVLIEISLDVCLYRKFNTRSLVLQASKLQYEYMIRSIIHHYFFHIIFAKDPLEIACDSTRSSLVLWH